MDARSEKNLIGIHADLTAVVRKTHEDWTSFDDGNGFIVIEGLRTKERQAELVKAGASQTLNSRHLTGHAVDIACTVNGEINWSWPIYHRLAALMKSNARNMGIPIIAGADWPHFRDGPHFELDRAHYP